MHREKENWGDEKERIRTASSQPRMYVRPCVHLYIALGQLGKVYARTDVLFSVGHPTTAKTHGDLFNNSANLGPMKLNFIIIESDTATYVRIYPSDKVY